MARPLLFAGAQFIPATRASGQPIYVPLNFGIFTAATGTTRHTDLLVNGAAATSFTTAADGQVPKVEGPDGSTDWWLDVLTPGYAMSNGRIQLRDLTAGGTGGGAVSSVAGKTGVVTLTKTDVGLSNVPNTDATARANHTGTQSADTLTDGTTNKAFLATERTKLTGIATGATANDTDANLKNRANHTGTQPASTISDSTAAGRAILTAADAVAQRTSLDVYGKTEALSYNSAASSATPAPVGSSKSNEFVMTALAAAAAFTNPSGTAADGNYLVVIVKDNGTARAITWGTAYKAADTLTLPSTTVVGKTHYWVFRYSGISSKWVLVDTRTET